MSQTVGDLMKQIKTSCDNSTLMYCFKNSKIAKAYNRTILFKPWISRVKPVISYAIYNSDDSFKSWDVSSLAKAGNIAFDSREHDAETTITVEYSGSPSDTATIKRTTTVVKKYDFDGSTTTTTTVVYTYNGVNYSTPVAGSVTNPVYSTTVDNYTIVNTINTANPNYLKVYKYLEDSIGNYYWEQTSYTAKLTTETLSSGNIDTYYSYANEDDTYYRRDILKRSIRTSVLNIYYKNSNGVWIDYNECIKSYPEYDIDEASKIWTKRLSIDVSILPRCEYVDSNGYRFFIDAADGSETDAEVCTNIELDTVRSYTVLSKELKFTPENDTDVLTYLSGEVPPTLSGFKFNNWSYVRDGSAITSSNNKRYGAGVQFTVYAVYYRNTETVKYEPCSIDDSTISWKHRFMYDDLKVTLPDGYKKNQFLVWLNGAFVPSTKDSTYENILYLKNAMTMIGSKSVNLKLGSTLTAGEYGTVTSEDGNNEYRYDINLRLFGWKGVKVSDFYKPSSSTTTPITYNFESIYPLKTLTFPIEINTNAHLIICNGKVLTEDEYYIDSNDPKTVILKNIETEGNSLLNEMVKEIDDNIEFYENVNPLHLVRSVLLERNYSLINFESTDDTKELYLKNSNACAVDFPMKGEITFSRLKIGDLVLIDGLFKPYLWVHQNTIKFPKMESSYNDGIVDKTYAENVLRYYFILKDK